MDTQMSAFVGGVEGVVILAVIGLIIGAVAKLLVPGRDPGGWFVTILLGIAGALVGGFACRLVGVTGLIPGLIAAVLGAALLLSIYRIIRRKQA